MDTSDRQVAETGRNRELGLIPAMVMAVVATLSGAGVSFAPLYERIWGGMMLHPNCPAIGRMTYYLSGQATDDYGACVTSPLWFMTVTALSVVAILCLTVAGVQGFSRAIGSVPVALFWSGLTFFTYSYNTGRHTDFCPALSATDNAGLVAYCIGREALGLLTVVLCVLPLFSLLSAIMAITLAAHDATPPA